MKRPLPLLFLLAATACATPGTGGGARDPDAAPALPHGDRLRVQVHERFYAVEGVSAGNINRELAGRGPSVSGRRWQAVTDFALRWRYLPRERGGRCSAEDAVLDVDIVTTLPRWRDRSTAPPELASDWDLYLRRLRRHEAVHQRIVVMKGKELLASVARLRAPDCDALRERARFLSRRARAEVDAAHREWDRASRHGVRGW